MPSGARLHRSPGRSCRPWQKTLRRGAQRSLLTTRQVPPTAPSRQRTCSSIRSSDQAEASAASGTTGSGSSSPAAGPPGVDSTGHERSTPPSQICRVGHPHRPCELGHGQAHRLWHRELFDGRCSGGRGLVIQSSSVVVPFSSSDLAVARHLPAGISSGGPPPQLPRSPGQRHRPGSRV